MSTVEVVDVDGALIQSCSWNGWFGHGRLCQGSNRCAGAPLRSREASACRALRLYLPVIFAHDETAPTTFYFQLTAKVCAFPTTYDDVERASIHQHFDASTKPQRTPNLR